MRWAFLTGLGVLVVAVHSALEPLRIASSSGRLPRWDEAKYGLSGLRLSDALADLDLLRFLVETSALSVWPPTWPIAQIPAFALGGPSVATPRIFAATLWLALVVVTWWAARSLVRTDRPAWREVAGAAAASLFALSPAPRVFATLGMLEIPGLLLLALALGTYVRALERETPGAWRAAWIVTTLLFFCKYNYGLLWLVPLAVAEVVRRAGSWRAAVAAGRAVLATIRWRSPWIVFVGAMLLVLVATRLLGGFEGEILGWPVRLTSPGNPLYFLFLLALGRAAWRLREPRRRDAWRRRFGSLDRPARSFSVWVTAPIVLWMSIPPHVKDFVGFVENRSSGLGFFDSLLFYPRTLIENYAPNPALGTGMLVLAVGVTFSGLVARGPSAPRRRVLALVTLATAAALVGHPYKLSRFAVTLGWLVVVSTGVAVADLGARLPLRAKRGVAATIAVAWLVGMLAGALVFVDRDEARQALEAEHRSWTIPATVVPVLDVLVAEPEALILGTWNDLSPRLLEWHARGRRGRGASPPATGYDLVRRRPDRLSTLLEEPRFEIVGILERIDASPDAERFAVETAWLEPLRHRLEAAPWRVAERNDFVATGYRVTFYERSLRGSLFSE